MIKNYLTYIKEHVHDDLDPYGEDEWEELPPVIEIAKRQNKPYDKITTLNCYDKQLTNIAGIENLINLKNFSCSNNELTSLEGIENLTNLEYLYCYMNQLTSLKGIENLINLKELDCSNNQLTNLESIENLINLKLLFCHDNQFTNEYKEYLREYCKKRKIMLSI